MQKFRHISKYFLQGLIPLLLLMYANAAVNKHYHQISDGETIVHAHPFSASNSGKESHNHTNEEIQFLATVGNPDQLIFLILIALILTFFPFSLKLILEKVYFHDFKNRDLFRNKAPPYYRFVVQ